MPFRRQLTTMITVLAVIASAIVWLWDATSAAPSTVLSCGWCGN